VSTRPSWPRRLANRAKAALRGIAASPEFWERDDPAAGRRWRLLTVEVAGGGELLSDPVWDAIRPHLPDVRTVRFVGRDDPLRHPRLAELAEAVRGAGGEPELRMRATQAAATPAGFDRLSLVVDDAERAREVAAARISLRAPDDLLDAGAPAEAPPFDRLLREAAARGVDASAPAAEPGERPVCDLDPRDALFVRVDGAVSACFRLGLAGTEIDGRLPGDDLAEVFEGDAATRRRERFAERKRLRDHRFFEGIVGCHERYDMAIRDTGRNLPPPPTACRGCPRLGAR